MGGRLITMLGKWIFNRLGNTAGRVFTARDEATPRSAEQIAKLEASARESALEHLKTLSLAATDEDRFYALPSAAMAAYAVGRFDDAQQFADESLQLAQRYEDDWNHGNAVNAAHTIWSAKVNEGGIPNFTFSAYR
jgi:hypothetical protein